MTQAFQDSFASFSHLAVDITRPARRRRINGATRRNNRQIGQLLQRQNTLWYNINWSSRSGRLRSFSLVSAEKPAAGRFVEGVCGKPQQKTPFTNTQSTANDLVPNTERRSSKPIPGDR
ncbi:hypothetical protein ABZU76_50300 [Amycolatopsis sp. NPDC005232]|uniref:hypothetical protein n=1 Tax=Amycolatopsis sp. NPDC005232 TaxID=3157027 RepID=UPI0033BB05A5